MRRLKKRAGNRLAKVRYYDKNAQNAASEEEAEVITEESEEVVETEEVAEEAESADEAETAEAAETSEEVAEEEPEVVEEVEVAGTDEPEAIEEVGKITEPAPTTEEEEEANAIEEVAEAVEPETENTETTEEVEAVKEVAEEPTEAEKAEELAVTATEELAEEEAEEVEAAEEAEEKAEAAAEEKPAEKDAFKLTAPSNLEEILSGICVKRGRKLIYRPNEILFNETATVLGTDKNNEEGIKVKNILDEEIKQGVKLGYIDKYDGLKMSEIKEEYENDTVYEYAEQEFKRTGLLLDGDKVKVYIYDWDMKALHHIGYIKGEEAEAVKPYLIDREKYSFDICGLITGGKYRKVIKDESGKVTVEKGNDGKLGVELDISVIARKD